MSVSPHRVTPRCTESLPGPTQLRSRGMTRRELCGDGGSGPALCRGGTQTHSHSPVGAGALRGPGVEVAPGCRGSRAPPAAASRCPPRGWPRRERGRGLAGGAVTGGGRDAAAGAWGGVTMPLHGDTRPGPFPGARSRCGCTGWGCPVPFPG